MIAMFAVLILLLVVGLPIGFSLMLSSFTYLLSHGDVSFTIMTQKFADGVNSFTLLAVPFFILAGNFMNASGVTDRLFGFAKSIVGHIPGGLAHANVVANVIMAGMSGSAVADAAGLGAVEVKAMRDDGYDDDFTAAVIGAASLIGPIIPPSIPMVIYAVLSGTSVAALFAAGFIPGFLMAGALMIMIYYFAIKRGYPRHPRTTALNLAKTFLVSLPALFMPIVILGGIFSGMFTPTEAGAVAVAYSLVLGGLAYRSLSWGGIKQVFIESAYTTASVMLVVIGCSLFAWILAIEQIPTMLGNFIISIVHMNGALFLLAVNLFLLFLGCFLEPVAAMLITIPIFMPICVKLGIHPVHFGIIVVLNLMIGLLTPPVGLVLNVMADLVDRPFAQMVKAVFPFMIVLIVVLLIVTYFPGLVMFLPRFLGYV